MSLGFFKMLIILGMNPVTTPCKTMFGKQLVAQIIMVDPIRVSLTSIHIRCSIGRLNRKCSVHGLNIRVIQWIDIDRHTESML